MQSNNNDKLISKLRKLGGQSVTDDSLVFSGSKFIIPEKLEDVGEAIKFLKDWRTQNEQHFDVSKEFPFKPWDGAAAFDRAIRALTGMGGFGVTQRSFFGDQNPEYRTVKTSVTEDMQVPWGYFGVPMLEAGVTLGATRAGNFVMTVTAPRKNRAAIDGLFKLVEDELEQRSIYRGKAIDGEEMPNFIDVNTVDFEKIVYSDEVQTQLEANVWSAILHADQLEKLGVASKRAVLFEGDYGTGKTLAAFRTAKIAIENGWTFVYCRPGKDEFSKALRTAQQYQPAVVFFEDIDTMSDSSMTNNTAISALLDEFDGIQSKGTRLLAVMTTNHADRIHKGMVRPGRLDAVIHIGALDRHGIETLIRKSVDSELLGDVNYDLVYESMAGFVPAFAKECIDRAMRYALSRTDGSPEFVLTTSDFEAAAHGLRPQLDLMNEAGEGERAPKLDEAMRELLTTMSVYDGEDAEYYAMTRAENA